MNVSDSNASIEYKEMIEGKIVTKKALGAAVFEINKKTGFRISPAKMYLSNKAFSSREQLAFVMQHEINHLNIGMLVLY